MPSEWALQAISSAVDSYVTITQMPDSKAFIVESVRRFLADGAFTASIVEGALQAQFAERANTDRPYPSVIAAAWMACAHGAEAIHLARREEHAAALHSVVEATRCAGFAQGACSELVSKYNALHSSAKTNLATMRRVALGAEKDLLVKEAACRPYCSGLKKNKASEEIYEHERLIGLTPDEIYKRLCRLFPKERWKNREIER
jgi:hypothetical protein